MKAGFIGLIGLPNSGKSTLLNHLVEQKIAIVTPKPQTTRRRVHGVVQYKQDQIIFVDSPGIVQAKGELNSFLAGELKSVMNESDALLVVLALDTDRKQQIEQVLDFVSESKKPWISVVTKTDLEEFKHRLPMIREVLEARGLPPPLHFACPTKKAGTIGPSKEGSKSNQDDQKEQDKALSGAASDLSSSHLLGALSSLLPESTHPLYDPDLVTPHTLRELAAEIIREKCFLHLEKEVPYGLAVRIQEYEDKGGLDRIRAHILVEKRSHVSMVVGTNAARLKEIGTQARMEIEALAEKKVFLDLKVIHREGWTSNRLIMQELGYVADSNHRSTKRR